MALESREGSRASRRVEEGLSRSFSGSGVNDKGDRLRKQGSANFSKSQGVLHSSLGRKCREKISWVLFFPPLIV